MIPMRKLHRLQLLHSPNMHEQYHPILPTSFFKPIALYWIVGEVNRILESVIHARQRDRFIANTRFLNSVADFDLSPLVKPIARG